MIIRSQKEILRPHRHHVNHLDLINHSRIVLVIYLESPSVNQFNISSKNSVNQLVQKLHGISLLTPASVLLILWKEAAKPDEIP